MAPLSMTLFDLRHGHFTVDSASTPSPILPSCIHVVAAADADLCFLLSATGWWDIGYNFLVGEDGNVYEGRGWNNEGAHVRGHNHNSLGIAIIGSFQNRRPNHAALYAATQLIRCGVLTQVSDATIMLSISVCLSVCRSICRSTYITRKPYGQTSPNFWCMLPVTVFRFFCDGVAIRYVLPILWMT